MLRKTFIVLATTMALCAGFAAGAMAQTGGFSGDLGYVGGSAGGQIGGNAGDFRHRSPARFGDTYGFHDSNLGHAGFDNGPPSCLINDPDNLRSCTY
jgi:hypothetical protein